MKALLLSLGACAALAGCVGYGGAIYGDGGYGYDSYGYSYPGYGSYGTYGTYGGGVYAPGYRDGGRRGQRDRDGDGIPNRMDPDRDGDGVRNRADSRPNNPRRN
jgi:hypothetical protein